MNTNDCAEIRVDVVIPTKNEELAITDCIRSLQGRFSSILVVDSGSLDATCSLAERAGARPVRYEWDGKYPKKKQWCLENLPFEHEWVLFLDADERATPEFLDELVRLQARGWDGCAAFDVPLSYHWRGRRLRHGQVVTKRVILNREKCRFPVIDDLASPGMGEQEGHYQPLVSGKVGRVAARIVHDDPDPVRDWIARHNRYSDWEAFLRTHPEVLAQVRGARSRHGRVLDRLPFKPLVVFVYNYLFKAGWRDGRAGFEYAMSLAIYQWQISLKVRDLTRLAAG